MRHSRISIRLLCLTLTLLGLLLALIETATSFAQQNSTGWSTPKMILQAEGSLATSGISLIADRMGGLHLFYAYTPTEDALASINYVSWNEETGWSEPVDIVVDSIAAFPRAAIDSSGRIHLIYLGQQSGLKYITALYNEADTAIGWSVPQTLAASLGDSDILLASNDSMIVAYPDATTIGQISVIQSKDGGQTWSLPSAVAFANQANTVPNEVRLVLDKHGHLHSAWTEYELPDAWPPTGVYYARTSVDFLQWALPIQVDGPNHAQVAVFTNDENVHLVWRSTIGGDGTFHKVSTDGGQTWSMIDRADDRGGVSGLPSFAIDSLSTVHYVIGRGSYAFWSANSLSNYQSPVSSLNLQATESVERATLAVTNGNQVHIVVEVDFQSLWHTTLLLDTPRLTGEDYPLVNDQHSIDAESTSTPNSSAAIEITVPQSFAANNVPQVPDNVFILVYTFLPTLLFVGIVAWLYRQKNSRLH